MADVQRAMIQLKALQRQRPCRPHLTVVHNHLRTVLDAKRAIRQAGPAHAIAGIRVHVDAAGDQSAVEIGKGRVIGHPKQDMRVKRLPLVIDQRTGQHQRALLVAGKRHVEIKIEI